MKRVLLFTFCLFVFMPFNVCADPSYDVLSEEELIKLVNIKTKERDVLQLELDSLKAELKSCEKYKISKIKNNKNK